MKIILSGNGFIDPVNTFAETSKAKFLKNIMVLSRDRYYIARMDKKISVMDYSGPAPQNGEGLRETEQRMLRRIKAKLADSLKRSGDVLYIASCEPSEAYALPVIQEVCEENDLRFHAFLVAPFLFQGKKPADIMSEMLDSISDSYSSVSLYYADELLRLENQSKREEGSQENFNPYTMQNAFDVLEKAVVDIATDMYRQIPKLDRGMQYTYDFNWEQFSLAVDPLSLLREMWHGLVNDRSLYPKQSEGEKAASAVEGSEDSKAQSADAAPIQSSQTTLASVDSGKLARLVGILDPDNRKKKQTSVYTKVKKNTIPMTVFKEQVGDSKINELVERIRTHVGSNGRYDDPAFRKKAEDRLRREINKFQVRQEAAERKFNGQQPTEFLSEDEALASVYRDDLAASAAASSEGDSSKENYDMRMATPFQRAARNATMYKDKPKSWAEISREKKSGKADGQADSSPISSAGEKKTKAPEKVRTENHETGRAIPASASGETVEKEEKEVLAPSPELWREFASLKKKEKEMGERQENTGRPETASLTGENPPASRPEKKATADTADKEAGSANIDPNTSNGISPSRSGGVMDFTFRPARSDSPVSTPSVYGTTSDKLVESAGIYTERSVSAGDPSQKAYDRSAERARKKAEKQAAKINRRLAKAEEKAALAAAKAAQAKLEVEIIAREKDQ